MIQAAHSFLERWDLTKPYFEVQIEVTHALDLQIGQAPITGFEDDEVMFNAF